MAFCGSPGCRRRGCGGRRFPAARSGSARRRARSQRRLGVSAKFPADGRGRPMQPAGHFLDGRLVLPLRLPLGPGEFLHDLPPFIFIEMWHAFSLCFDDGGCRIPESGRAPPPWTWFLKENASRQLGQIKRFPPFLRANETGNPQKGAFDFSGQARKSPGREEERPGLSAQGYIRRFVLVWAPPCAGVFPPSSGRVSSVFHPIQPHFFPS